MACDTRSALLPSHHEVDLLREVTSCESGTFTDKRKVLAAQYGGLKRSL